MFEGSAPLFGFVQGGLLHLHVSENAGVLLWKFLRQEPLYVLLLGIPHQQGGSSCREGLLPFIDGKLFHNRLLNWGFTVTCFILTILMGHLGMRGGGQNFLTFKHKWMCCQNMLLYTLFFLSDGQVE